MDLNSIARTERNSLSFRQLVQPGCQKTFSMVSLCIATLSSNDFGYAGVGDRSITADGLGFVIADLAETCP